MIGPFTSKISTFILLTVWHTFHSFALSLRYFQNFPGPVALFQDFLVLENVTGPIRTQDFPGPVRTLFNNSKRCCIDRLIFRSKQNCETYFASHCNDRLFGTGKVQVTAKNPFQRCELKLFRNAENFIDIGECTKTLSLLNVLMLRYLQKVQGICGEFLADMPNDLPYILGCDWNFLPRVKHGDQLAWMCLWCEKTRNDS